ncbi:MAG: DUF2914 domain-containing protein [Azoarcus sp.]|nr:DUF2914 domain-containing protein [Azoarcus sp.]
MTILKTRVLRLVVTLRRYKGLLALFGFFSGVASFMLVDRQEDFARVIALIMLVSWPWLLLENVLRRWLDVRFHFRLPAPVLRYATQMIHQESLFFVLPFLFIATTWTSGQAVFTGLIICAALISLIDPVYYKWLAPRRWLFLGFHTLALFVVLLTALPILLNVPTHETYLYALFAAVLLSFPSLAAVIRARTHWRGLLLAVLVVALGAFGWVGRFWVPPSTLRLTDIQFALEMDRERRAPSAPVFEVSAERLHGEGLFAYTAIHAPLGLQERIFHVWMLDGVEVDRIPLEIQGGRERGYRAWTHKLNFPEDSGGRWRVEVVTESGQMIGRGRFRTVAETPAPD